jgi:Mycothiol maleylpyruvate isomerase N-terminal domain
MTQLRESTSLDQAEEIDEVGEFITTLFSTPPTRLTNCRGWTAHELVAHLAAGAAEEAELIEAHLVGGPPRETRAHHERELPFRALPDPELREQLVSNAGRLTLALDQLGNGDASDRVQFSGRAMSAADFAMHSRSECALHRWDLVGRDDIGWKMLGQAALTKHALSVLTSMSTLPETPANRLADRSEQSPARLVLRSEPHDDVVVSIAGGALSMTLEPIGETRADVELDPAARLLLLWGRREPSAPIDVHVQGDARPMLDALMGC